MEKQEQNKGANEQTKKETNRFQQGIDNHKKRGINTFTVTCGNGLQCLIREPTVSESGKILPYLIKIGDNDPDFIKAGNQLIKSCWIAGDDEIRQNEDLAAEVAFSLLSIVQLKVADVKKN